MAQETCKRERKGKMTGEKDVERPKFLFLTTEYPFPQNNGGKIKSASTIEVLSEFADIDVICFSEDPSIPKQVQGGLLGVNRFFVEYLPIRSSQNRLFTIWRLIWSFLKSYPYAIFKFYKPAFEEKFRLLLSNNNYDLVYVDHLAMAQYPYSSNVPYVLDEHNFESGILGRRAAQATWLRFLVWKREESMSRRFEALYCNHAKLVFAISQRDMNLLRGIGVRTQITVLPPFIKREWPQYSMNMKKRQPTCLILGSLYWEENLRAAKWFLDNVLQFLDTDIQIKIAGDGARSRLAEYTPLPRVELLDGFSNINEVVQGCNLLAVPLQTGGGIRIKIIQALKSGFPVISTRIGVEGIDGLNPGDNIVVRDIAREFADELNKLLFDSNELRNLSNKAAEWGRKYYTKENFVKILSSNWLELKGLYNHEFIE